MSPGEQHRAVAVSPFRRHVLVAGAFATNAHGKPVDVVQAIRTQDRIARRTPGFVYLNAHLNTSSETVAKKLVSETGPLVRASRHAIAVVARSSTSSARQRKGKSEGSKGHASEYRPAAIPDGPQESPC